MKELSVKELFEKKKKDFALSVITQPRTLNNTISEAQLNRPGMALAGYLDRFSYKRVQMLGETEISYLQTFSDDALYERLKEMFEYGIPCIFITKGLSVPHQMEYLANEMNIALISSRLTTEKLALNLSQYLRNYFAPKRSLHGTLVDVFGVGILITGSSGIGKSECALDLVERGHRLIADDLVKITLQNNTLMGTPARDAGWFMEIRGVGIVDIERMFGIQAVRLRKQIEVQVELMPWRDNMDYERIGLKNNWSSIHGVNIPVIYLPVSPGKNVSVIIEVISMNHILKTFGYDAAEAYTRRLKEEIKRQSRRNR
ncbi:MAG: HPr(Ser) kinase/phosphatase [Candidatus Cloacimonetes bacterium]|nr:HPr(Ser) kinase/phosphatase [Candidatus Cloacimonadota bacterium]